MKNKNRPSTLKVESGRHLLFGEEGDNDCLSRRLGGCYVNLSSDPAGERGIGPQRPVPQLPDLSREGIAKELEL